MPNKITINKIGIAKGGIAFFKVKVPITVTYNEQDFDHLKDVVHALKNPRTGLPESENCWEISLKGSNMSDIVINRHASEVVLMYTDGTEQLLQDAIKDL